MANYLDRCPREGCAHQRYTHGLEPHGLSNTMLRTGRCQADDCACRAWDDSREMDQADYVRKWRQEHPVDVWGEPWRCPLCGKAVQDFYSLTAHAAQIADHTDTHGEDYQRYLALGAQDSARGGGEG